MEWEATSVVSRSRDQQRVSREFPSVKLYRARVRRVLLLSGQDCVCERVSCTRAFVGSESRAGRGLDQSGAAWKQNTAMA